MADATFSDVVKAQQETNEILAALPNRRRSASATPVALSKLRR